MPSSSPEHLVISRRSLRTIRALALTAAAVAGYLTWITLTHGTVAACGDDSPHIACDDVLRSPWSRVVGVPVSLLGFAVYFSILLTSWWMSSRPTHRQSDWARLSFFMLVTLAAGSAVWFLFLQLFVMGKICPFCMMIHACGMLIAAVSLFAKRIERNNLKTNSHLEALRKLTIGMGATLEDTSRPSQGRRAGQRLWPAACALIGLLLLITVQIAFPAKTFEVREADERILTAEVGNEAIEQSNFVLGLDRNARADSRADSSSAADAAARQTEIVPPAEPEIQDRMHAANDAPSAPRLTNSVTGTEPTRTMKFLKGRLEVDVHEHGLLGSPKADLFVIELVDYTCPDCRKVHQYLKRVREQYGDRFAVIVFPVPLERTCNRFIRYTHSKHIGACKYARLALAVLSIAPDKFGKFHDWLMESDKPPTLEKAYRYAGLLVEPEQLPKEGQPGRLQEYMQLFNAEKIHRLPALIIGDQVFIGVPNNPNVLLDVIEKRFDTI